MKPVLLSADSEIFAYMVPNEVADHLIDYCENFLDWNSKPCYTEKDFIDYLNTKVFSDTKSWLIETAGSHRKDILKKYKTCARYNF